MKVVIIVFYLALSFFLFSSQPAFPSLDFSASGHKLELSGIFSRSYNPLDLARAQSSRHLDFSGNINLGNVHAFLDIMRALRFKQDSSKENEDGSISVGIAIGNAADVFDVPLSWIFSSDE